MSFEHIEEKEAVKRAALIETNGIAFYTLLADKTDDKEVKRVFKMLVHDEKKHLKALESEHFPEAGLGEEITDEELEVEEYVKKLGVPDIFSRKIDINKLVDLVDDPKKALLIALDTERHSIEFFEAMSKKASTEEARKIYAELADDEREHEKHIAALLEDY